MQTFPKNDKNMLRTVCVRIICSNLWSDTDDSGSATLAVSGNISGTRCEPGLLANVQNVADIKQLLQQHFPRPGPHMIKFGRENWWQFMHKGPSCGERDGKYATEKKDPLGLKGQSKIKVFIPPPKKISIFKDFV